MGVGGLLHVRIVPGILIHVVRPGGHAGQQMILVGRTAQHAVEDGHGLSAGDVLVGTERTVGEAVDDAGFSGLVDVVFCPVVFNVGELVGAGIGHLEEAHRDSGKLGTGDRRIGAERTIGEALDHTGTGHGRHGRIAPGIRLDIRVGVALAPQLVAGLIRQHTEVDGSHLAAGDLILRMGHTVLAADDVGVVVGLVQVGQRHIIIGDDGLSAATAIAATADAVAQAGLGEQQAFLGAIGHQIGFHVSQHIVPAGIVIIFGKLLYVAQAHFAAAGHITAQSQHKVLIRAGGILQTGTICKEDGIAGAQRTRIGIAADPQGDLGILDQVEVIVVLLALIGLGLTHIVHDGAAGRDSHVHLSGNFGKGRAEIGSVQLVRKARLIHIRSHVHKLAGQLRQSREVLIAGVIVTADGKQIHIRGNGLQLLGCPVNTGLKVGVQVVPLLDGLHRLVQRLTGSDIQILCRAGDVLGQQGGQGGERGIAAVRRVGVHQVMHLAIGGGVGIADRLAAVQPGVAAAVGDQHHILLRTLRQRGALQIRQAPPDAGLNVGTEQCIRFLQHLGHAVGKVCVDGSRHRGHGQHVYGLVAEHRDAHIDVFIFCKGGAQLLSQGLDQAQVAFAVQAAGTVQHKLHRHGILIRRRRDGQRHRSPHGRVQTLRAFIQQDTIVVFLSRIRPVVLRRVGSQGGRRHAKEHDSGQDPRKNSVFSHVQYLHLHILQSGKPRIRRSRQDCTLVRTQPYKLEFIIPYRSRGGNCKTR